MMIKSIKSLFASQIFHDLVLVQEMMCLGVKACEDFLKIFLGWEVCAIYANGHLRGLLTIWNLLVSCFISALIV